MAISKRLRYEVLRRDGHTCRYCGGRAPDVKLTVDHVVPSALGGSDDPTNLVAACRDCNSGKSASAPDAPMVADVDEKAAEWARAMSRVIEQRAVELQADRERIRQFDRQWIAIENTVGFAMPRDVNWKNSVHKFLAAGLDDEFVFDAIAASAGMDRVSPFAKWRYFCGICWKEIDELIRRTGLAVSGQLAAPERGTRDADFDYMAAFTTFTRDLVASLGGTDQVAGFVEIALFDVMGEVHDEWTKRRPEVSGDDGGDLVMEEISMRAAKSMDELRRWHELRNEFAKRFLSMTLATAGMPESAIEIAKRCFKPSIEHALAQYARRIATNVEPEQHTFDAVEWDMYIKIMDALSEMTMQTEAAR